MNTLAAEPQTIRMTSGELATLVDGQLIGPSDVVLSAVETLEQAGPEALSFVRNVRHIHQLAASRCGAVLVSRAALAKESAAPDDYNGKALIVVDDADLALITLLELLTPKPLRHPGVHASAAIDPSAQLGSAISVGSHVAVGPASIIGDGCVLDPGVVIGAKVTLGKNCFIHPNVTILDRCVLGDRCIVHAGAVIGADGFGYRPHPSGQGLIKIPHAGNVAIGDNVDIGANTCIDRAKFGSTLIGDGTKIDNLVQIGHGCRIGRCCIICGTSALSGSVTLEDGVMLGGGAAVADGYTLGAGAMLGARSGLFSDISPGQRWFGYPARPSRQAFREFSMLRKLPDLMRKIRTVVDEQSASR